MEPPIGGRHHAADSRGTVPDYAVALDDVADGCQDDASQGRVGNVAGGEVAQDPDAGVAASLRAGGLVQGPGELRVGGALDGIAGQAHG